MKYFQPQLGQLKYFHLESRHSLGVELVDVVPQTQLAVPIVSPAVDLPVLQHSHGARLTAGDPRHFPPSKRGGDLELGNIIYHLELAGRPVKTRQVTT